MNYLDTLYRALVDYRKNTLTSNECKIQRNAVMTADSENDEIEITRKNCIVEEDWIDAIERGLEFIEKAIKEERQFIRSNGEVVPIEKVKRVSKDSVEHLARHSNLFTREPENEGDDLIPDQLYTVERLSDYAVYENRFLYMLLCYLRDFIGMRYEKILELTNTYQGKMSMNKSIVESNRRIRYEVKLEEEKKNDEYLREHNKAQREIDRILMIYKAVVVFLNTPLLIEVAKTPMLKPPVTRTNVLKMNRNFREALSLYEFVTAYDRDGYTITTETRTVSPFVGVVGEEMAEAVELSLFLTYEHGLGIKDYLKENYETEEARRRDEERRKFAEQLRNISRHLKTSGTSPEEYIQLLEKRIRDLEKEEEELFEAKKKIEELTGKIARYKAELSNAHETIRSLGNEITRLNQKYADDMAAAETAFNERIRILTEEHENAIQSLEQAHAERVEELQQAISDLETAKRQAEEEHIRAMQLARTEFAGQLSALNADYEEKFNGLNAQIAEGVEKLNELNARYVALEEEKMVSQARLNALRSEHGLMTEKDDFSSKEKTDELERQLRAFKKFFKQEWQKTKKKIRKEVFAEVANETKTEKQEEISASQPTMDEETETTENAETAGEDKEE